MNNEALKAIQSVIDAWLAEKEYHFENKQVYSFTSPTNPEEFLLKFSNSIRKNRKEDVEDEIVMSSEKFITTSLSENPSAENLSADVKKLKKVLKDLDEKYYKEANEIKDKI